MEHTPPSLVSRPTYHFDMRRGTRDERREKQLFYSTAVDFTEVRAIEGGEAEGDFL